MFLQTININDFKERGAILIDRIMIKGNRGIDFVDLDDIYFIKKADKQIIFHTKDQKYLATTTLDELEGRLPEHFFRSHRSYLINIEKLNSITSNGGRHYKVQFNGIEKEALISYGRKKELMLLLNYKYERRD